MPQETQKLMVKVRLFTTDGHLVDEAYSLPYQHWPQAFWYGQRLFVRNDFKTDPAHTSDDPPPYFECAPVMAYSAEMLASLGIV